MALADTFQQIVDSLPDDWTDLQLDVRIFDESQLHGRGGGAWSPATRSRTPSTTGTGASSSRTGSATPPRRRRSTRRCGCSTRPGIDGELALREMRTGRAEIVPTWGRPESVRQEFRRIRAQ